MPFAALESRINASVLKHLANVRLTINGGSETGGIFRDPYATADLGIDLSSTAPSVTVDTSAVPSDPIGMPVQIVDGAAFRIADHKPDGTGLTVIVLEKAS